MLLNIPLLVYMPSNEQSIRVPLPTTRDNLKKYIDDDFILDGKSLEKLIYPYWNTFRVPAGFCRLSRIKNPHNSDSQKSFHNRGIEFF